MTNSPLRSRLERLLARVPIPALRDVVAKRPSDGPNLDVLDGVRGLAVLLVIASHCNAFHLKGQGALGVFLFFSLSAFLLTMQFARHPERATDPARLRRYASRRVRRILPIYYGIILFTFFQKDGLDLDYLWRHLAFVRADGIFWTIPQEMLFYLLLPILALAHPLLFRRNAALSAIAMGIVAWVAHQTLDVSVFSLNGNGKQLPFYLGIFATGMAFSYAFHSPPILRVAQRPIVNRTLGWVAVAILALLFLSARHYHETVLNELPLVGSWFGELEPKMGLSYKAAFSFLCGLLIFATLAAPTRLAHYVLSSLFLRALGVTSYSLYLLHIIVRNKIASLGFAMSNEALFFWTLASAYVIACVLYAGIERPFMQVRERT